MDLVYAQGDSETGDPEKVFSLAFLDLQLLMSRYRSLYRESSQEHQLANPRLTELLNNLGMVAHLGVKDTGRCLISAKVVDEELLIRIETKILIAGPEEIGQNQIHLPQTCQHVQTRREVFWPSEMDWWSQSKWENTLVYRTRVGVPYRCRFCHTEYLATVKKEPESKSYLVEVSVWKNLGSFKSSSHEKWQRHLSHENTQEHLPENQCGHGFIHYRFESANEGDILKERAGWLSKLPLKEESNYRFLLPSHYFDFSLAPNS